MSETTTTTTLPATPTVNLRGWPVLRVWRGAAYLRIPRELQVPCDGCRCDYCRAHPTETPTWDTLGIPLAGANMRTWTLHAPEWRVGEKVSD